MKEQQSPRRVRIIGAGMGSLRLLTGEAGTAVKEAQALMGARRIVEARRHAALDFPDLKRFGVVLKRAMYFITCSGRVMMPFRQDQDAIAASLAGEERRRAWEIGEGNAYRQMSLFDDFHITVPPTAEDVSGAVWGVM